MATTDHGELLTKFEEIFGTVVEHEVIKMVLQNCDWNSSSAKEMILSMIDPDTLPPHIKCGVTADAILRGGNSLLPGSPTLGDHERFRSRSPDDRDRRDNDSHSEGEDTVVASHSTTESPTGSIGLPSESCSGRANHVSWPSQRPSFSRNSALTPFAMAQGSYVSSDTRWNSGPAALDSMYSGDEEAEAVKLSGLSGSESLSDRESDFSLPNSPFKPSAPQPDSANSVLPDTARWVLAPEFVPNALHPNSSNLPLSPNCSQPFVRALMHRTNAKGSKKDEIIGKIKEGVKMIVLMRGLPGSGKSTLAREIKGFSGIVLSTDDYFIDKKGRYVYEPSKISEAHSWNKNRARKMLEEMRSPIVIDNTNLQVWEMKPYVQLALHHGYEIDILEPETSWKFNVKELARRNSHGVPKDKIKEMRERYEKNVEIEDIIASVRGITVNNDLQDDNSHRKKEMSPQKKTDWPKTLPENVNLDTEPQRSDSQRITCNSKGGDNGRHSDRLGVENTRKDGTSSIGISGDALSELQKYGNGESDVDDADVVIESCEDMDSSFGAMANKSSKTRDETLRVSEKQSSLDHEVRDCQHETVRNDSVDMLSDLPIEGQSDVDNPVLNAVTENTTGTRGNDDLQDEEKIRLLIEEANMDTEENIEDWDDLIKNVNEEEINDERFNELVHDLGTSIRTELDKGSQGLCVSNDAVRVSDKEEFDDDTAMYELCSNIEERLGSLLSSVIARPKGSDEPSSLFSIINVDNSPFDIDNGKRNNIGEMSVVSESQTTGTFEVLSDNNDNVISKCDEKSCIQSVMSENCDSSSSKVIQEGGSSKMNTSGMAKEEFGQSSLLEGTENLCPVTANAKFLPEDTKEIVTLGSSNLISKDIDPIRTDVPADQCPSSLALTSWDCVDLNEGEAVTSWEQKKENVCEGDLTMPKPTRDRKRPSGDPQKWMGADQEDSSTEDQNSCSWEPIPDGAVASWEDARTVNVASNVRKLQSHTGAVPKVRKQDMKQISSVTGSRSNDSPSPKLGESHKYVSPVVSKSSFTNITSDENVIRVKQTQENETQTLSIDFQALEIDNNLYELKILYGQPDYIPVDATETMPLDNGPLTRGKLSLDKGTMTESSNDVTVAKSLRNLIAFFPKNPEPGLRDVLEKCNFDLDWAMNVLLDSGYEMADSVDVCSQESSEEFDDVDNTFETVNVSSNVGERLMDVDTQEEPVDLPLEEKNRRLRQSQTTESLASKKEIENSFMFPESVDDRVTRLTGKDFGELNVHKVKQKKSKKKHGKKKHLEATRESINWEEGEGAQFVTLVMDPLFASQLMSMFGPIGLCGMSGDMAPEDRSVILPLEFCHQIHKYWTKTLDGKFKHEGEVLDSLIREDENLARRLQEEENQASENIRYDENSSSMDNADKVFLLDPPENLREIMDLEQALWESQNDKSNGNSSFLSSQLSLQRLQAEYPHVDPEAVKQEFTESGCNYHESVKRISSRYGSEPGVPKTVVSPEYVLQYEQHLLRAKELSTSQQEPEEEEYLHDEEIQPDDPQMYRDEAQLHYHQRQEFYRKAQEAYRKGMKNVAAYYAALGKLHAEKLNEANKRASFKILEAVNSKNKKDANVLDLHLLHVPEALNATKAFLLEREQLLMARNINQLQVSLITGRGAHSVGGQAKLKPAIRDYLQKKGYTFHEGNSGMFVVTIQR
ncbi:NEDD4-binding protein 2-like [Macrobrachium rosenbergii]|uniref:NEDD4-binding protein 2-like n=1 Tax=Macrobrachium rosenbergii TaxID=79674 RepID=UPI0034D3DD58